MAQAMPSALETKSQEGEICREKARLSKKLISVLNVGQSLR